MCVLTQLNLGLRLGTWQTKCEFEGCKVFTARDSVFTLPVAGACQTPPLSHLWPGDWSGRQGW